METYTFENNRQNHKFSLKKTQKTKILSVNYYIFGRYYMRKKVKQMRAELCQAQVNFILFEFA